MASRRPRDIGTATESAVVRYLRTAGFPHAERRALRGALDAGDITGTPGVVWECKGGMAAKTASDGLTQLWLDETMRQVANAGADVGILVVQRAGIGELNAGRWWAVMPGWQYKLLAVEPGTGHIGFNDSGPIRMHLSQACALLVYAGYGSALVSAGGGDG
jgi:hypothetical protein